MMKWFTSFVLGCFLAPLAYSIDLSEIKKAVAEISTMQTEAERLAAYDELSRLILSDDPAEAVEYTSWYLDLSEDKISGKNIYTFFTRSSESRDVILRVQYVQAKVSALSEVRVLLPQPFFLDAMTTQIDCGYYSSEAESVKTQKLSVSPDKSFLIPTKPKDLLSFLIAASKVHLLLKSPYSDKTTEFSFEVHNLKTAVTLAGLDWEKFLLLTRK